MVRTLISYALAAGIITPPALLGTQTSPEPEVKRPVAQYPLLRTAQPVQPQATPHNPPTAIPPPVVVPAPQPVAPQFVTYRPEPVLMPTPLESPLPPEPPPEPAAILEPLMSASPVAALLPPPPPIETSDVNTPGTSTPPTDITILRQVVSNADITSTAPLMAYDIMSGELLWKTTEALTLQANNHQVLLDDQAHTELILTVPDDDLISVNGTDYSGGLIIRAQGDELYVIHYLSGDQIPYQFDISVSMEPSHTWYDQDSRLPASPPQIAHHGSP